MVDGEWLVVPGQLNLFGVVPYSRSSGYKDDFADILAFLDIRVCVAGCREREGFVDMRANPAICNPLQQDLHPTGDHLSLMPKMSDVHAEDTFVVIDERNRMKKRHSQRHRQHAERSE